VLPSSLIALFSRAAGELQADHVAGFAYFDANVTYNHAPFRDDIVASPTLTYPAEGKFLPDSAKWIVSGGITVEPSPWLVANLTAKYTSKRFSTFDNIAGPSVPSFTLFSA
jgi:iron complex outermembrane receptor protein